MITFRQSQWNVPGFRQAQPNAGLTMLNRLPLWGLAMLMRIRT